MTPPRVLSIAGSDPSGGAGIQADLKTFHAFGAYGMAVITALTAQNTLRVSGVRPVAASFVGAQVDALLGDCPPVATKTGMLHSADVVEVVVARAARLGMLVVDPVMVATSGDRLLRADAEEAVRTRLVPLADLVTPNTDEAAVLTGLPVESSDDALAAAVALVEMGAAAALVKGGHGVDRDLVHDSLVTRSGVRRVWSRPRLPVDGHGTGCTLSSAIVAGLALGLDVVHAIARAGDFVHCGLRQAFAVGGGAVPVNHLMGFDEEQE